MAELIVLAVYIPPHAPAPGQAAHSTRWTPLASSLPAWYWPTASKIDTMSMSAPSSPVPGRMLPPYTKMLGILRRAMAMTQPGMLFSQPPKARIPSWFMPPATISMLSAMTSRDTRL
jgi:hypothetical protein